jgi:hypothetical protein
VIAIDPRRLRRALTTATASLSTLPLAACTVAGTDYVYTPAQGVNDRGGTVDVLNALIVSSAEGEGRLVVGLANNDREQGDELTGVSGAREDSGVQVQLAGGKTRIDPGGFLQTADPGAANIMVSGDAVKPGVFVRLSMQFAQAEPVEVNVPVVEPGTDFAGVMSATASPSGSPSESSESPGSPGSPGSPSETATESE